MSQFQGRLHTATLEFNLAVNSQQPCIKISLLYLQTFSLNSVLIKKKTLLYIIHIRLMNKQVDWYHLHKILPSSHWNRINQNPCKQERRNSVQWWNALFRLLMSTQTDTLVKLQMWFPWKQRHTTRKNTSLKKSPEHWTLCCEWHIHSLTLLTAGHHEYTTGTRGRQLINRGKVLI